MAWAVSGRDFALGIVVGAVAALVIGAVAFATVLRTTDSYGLNHWKLNLRMPFDSMWMNLGYWKTSDGKPVQHFDEACLGLLKEILKTAGIIDKTSPSHSTPKPISVLDLGFGCGDQTLALQRLVQPSSWQDFLYVGITLNESQVQNATRSLQREVASVKGRTTLNQASFKLFHADAARPRSWNAAVLDAVHALADERFAERWLLALDCLYHFSPSRKPIFQYAAQKLDAGVMAFDLILNERASWKDMCLVRMVGLIMGCPLFTFLTEDEYKEQLVECGYDPSQIIIRDISDDVFAGVTSYLQRQEAALSQYGISIGGFKLAGRLFGWFDRSRVVKAVIVVSRTKSKSE